MTRAVEDLVVFSRFPLFYSVGAVLDAGLDKWQ